MIAAFFVAIPHLIQLLLVHLFEVEQGVVGLGHHEDQLIELELQGFGITVLGILDEENHQKGNDGRPRVDNQLPGV